MVELKFQVRLFAYYIILISILFMILTVLFLNHLKSELTANAYRNLEQRSLEAAKNIDKLMDNGVVSIKAIGNNPILKSPDFSKEEKLEILNILHSSYIIFDEITLIDTDGNVIVSTASDFKRDWVDEKYFLNVLLGETIVSDIQKIGENKFVLRILSPVFDENKNIISVVVAQMSIDAFWDLTNGIKIVDTSFIFVLDNLGRVIAHPDKVFILKNSPYNLDVKKLLPSGTIDFKDVMDEKLIAGYSKLSEESEYKRDEWIVFAVQAEYEAFSMFKSILYRFILIAIFSFTITSIVALIFTKRIFKPISKLQRGIKAILAGDLGYEFQIKTGDELDEIANSIKDMIKIIKHKEILERLKTDLQTKVEELEKLNKLLVGREAEIKRLKNIIKKLKKR